MHDNIGASFVSFDKGFKIKYWNWPKMNISANMTQTFD